MKTFLQWRLALRLLARDWRAGELRILFIALVLAVAATTSISFMTDRLARGMVNQSADFLGADIILKSPRPVNKTLLRQASAFNLQTTESLQFASMVVSGDALQLSSVRAVDEQFPLRGKMRTASASYVSDSETHSIPLPGEAWAAPAILSRLNLSTGDSVTVGSLSLRITRVLTFEPGQAGEVFGVSPRLLINRIDVPATGVVQPGSRLTYQYLFAGDKTGLDAYHTWLKPQLDASHSVIGVHEGRRALGAALERAERYLGLGIMIAVILAGVAIAIVVRRYSERHLDVSAMLRCLGLSQQALLALYLMQLVVLGVAASAVGGLLGWLMQAGLLAVLSDLLPVAPSTTGIQPFLLGFVTGAAMLIGFALPPVMRLKNVPPLRVLRRDLLPMPGNAWMVYGFAIGTVFFLIWRYTDDIKLVLSAMLGAVVMALALFIVGFALLAVTRSLQSHMGVAWRFGLNNLWRRRQLSLSQISAFGLAFMAMLVIALVRNELISTWTQQLPADTPNHFAVNILPEQADAVQQLLASHDIETTQLYPMIRGRLVTINHQPVRTAVSKEAQGDNALNRELNLTWTLNLQKDNKILEGRWLNSGDTKQPFVSVESRLAERLGIELNDELGFTIGAQQLQARVLNIRSVQWDSFRPNFYMIFPPGVLDNLPSTYMTSFYMPAEKKPVLGELVRAYPAVTLIEMDLVLAQAQRIFSQISHIVEYVFAFLLLAGLIVLYAALTASQDERLYEGALMRTLGASSKQLGQAHLAEFLLLGFFAGVLAIMGTEAILWVLYSQLLELDYNFNPLLWIIVPLAGALFIGAAGYWSTRKVKHQSPMLLLNNS
ncbi:MAG: FtsX-like permease family protein [Gammaproteobacteria bacterium]